MIDYGTDFRLVDDDTVLSPDGDFEIISGPACAAQDIDQKLKFAFGCLFWDKDEGSAMPLFLNASAPDAAAIIAELERVAIADPRVNPETVKAYERESGHFRLEFAPLGAIEPEMLDYDLTKGKGD